MTYLIAVGEFEMQREYSYVHRNDCFDNPQSILPATDSKIRGAECRLSVMPDLAERLRSVCVMSMLTLIIMIKVFSLPEQPNMDNVFPECRLVSMPIGKTQMSLLYGERQVAPRFINCGVICSMTIVSLMRAENPLLNPLQQSRLD